MTFADDLFFSTITYGQRFELPYQEKANLDAVLMSVKVVFETSGVDPGSYCPACAISVVIVPRCAAVNFSWYARLDSSAAARC